MRVSRFLIVNCFQQYFKTGFVSFHTQKVDCLSFIVTMKIMHVYKPLTITHGPLKISYRVHFKNNLKCAFRNLYSSSSVSSWYNVGNMRTIRKSNNPKFHSNIRNKEIEIRHNLLILTFTLTCNSPEEIPKALNYIAA